MSKKVGSLFLFSYILCVSKSYVLAYDHNPELEEGYKYHKPKFSDSIDNFADEDVIALYRGVHLLPDKFLQDERKKFASTNHCGEHMFCSAAYEKAGRRYGSKQINTLKHQAVDIASQVNGLDDTDSINIKGFDYTNYRFAFQSLYSNNCLGFSQQLHNPSGDYEEVFENFNFTKNPLLSFSDKVRHPGKYGYGVKNFGTSTPLLPDYDRDGYPHHPILGKLFGVILDQAAVEELCPLNVYKAHEDGELTLKSHYSNNILSEHEISIAGYVPGDNVVFEWPLSVPYFSGNYKTYYERKYGMTQRQYNNYQKIFTNKNNSIAVRKEGEKKLLGELIEKSYQDNKLVYKNCLVPKVTDLFERKLDGIDARLGKLMLEYEIQVG